MNSERRHELQQNDLAVYLNKINKAIEPYSKLIAIAVGLLIVGAIIYGFYRSEQMGQRSEATLQLIQASQTQDAEVLMTVSNSYPDTVAGDWARLYQGQLLLSQGIQRLYSDREEAEQLLGDAKQALLSAITGSKDRLLKSRGQYGIALASEALGNLDEAIAEYEKVIQIDESEAMRKKAQERIEVLSKPETKAFVSWFADQDFSPADPSLPPKLPGSDALPGLPDFSLPPLNLGTEPGGAPRDLEGGIGLPEDGVAPTTTTEEATTEEATTEGATTEGATEIVLPENVDPAAPSKAESTPSEEPPAAAEPSAEAPEEPTTDPGADEDRVEQ